jgi:hypothetical protein
VHKSEIAADRFTLKFPPLPPLAGEEAAFFCSGRDKRGKLYEGWAYATLPGAKGSPQEVLVELRLDTPVEQLNGFKPRLEALLKRAEFKEDEIKSILEVKIVDSTEGKRRYFEDESIIELIPGDNLRNIPITFGHELGHHITRVIAQDDAPHVGIPHKEEDRVHPNLSWDEGRAHFYAWAFTKIVKLQGERSISNDWSTETEPAQRETFVYEGLVRHYSDQSLYPNIESALKDFRKVQKLAANKDSLGHPPRTLAEFISVKQKATTDQAIAKDLDEMVKRFNLGKQDN